jgi:hypothetical protein
MELDSHADTIVLGSNAVILQYTSRECDVSPYSDSYDPIQNVPIVKGATAVTNATTGETLILVFNEAIWMGNHLDHSLLNPNQLRHHGITVQDNPYANSSLHLASHEEEFIMPLRADGSTIYFDSRTPTNHELAHSPHITMSSHTEWNPRDVQFPISARHIEGGLRHEIGGVSSCTGMQTFDLSSADHDAVPITSLISDRLVSKVRISNVDSNVEVKDDVPLPRTFASGKRHSNVTAQGLSERWFIGLSQAHDTIKVTTQNCTQSAVLPLSRRYRADRVFEKPLLRGDFYTDTMDGRCKSLQGNRYAQIMANKDFFAIAYPMVSKSSAGD